MPELSWNGLTETGKENIINDMLQKSFMYAMDPAYAGKYAPIKHFKYLLGTLGRDDYSTWLSENDWVKGRIAGFEKKFGFGFEDVYMAVIIDPEEQGTTPENESWVSKNKITIGLVVVAIIVLGFIFYRKLKKK